ncbi:MAG TPA: GNAT family N-acetyltransferase [Caulobacteraceae bacterium]
MAITFTPAREEDFEPLLALRGAALRESLERVGRFNPQRGRERFRAGFSPEHTLLIHNEGVFAGCVTVRDEVAGTWLENLYLRPEVQGRGVGGRAMAEILRRTDAAGRTVRLSVLMESAANRFYQRLGFIETHREDVDIYYERRPPA